LVWYHQKKYYNADRVPYAISNRSTDPEIRFQVYDGKLLISNCFGDYAVIPGYNGNMEDYYILYHQEKVIIYANNDIVVMSRRFEFEGAFLCPRRGYRPLMMRESYSEIGFIVKVGDRHEVIDLRDNPWHCYYPFLKDIKITGQYYVDDQHNILNLITRKELDIHQIPGGEQIAHAAYIDNISSDGRTIVYHDREDGYDKVLYRGVSTTIRYNYWDMFFNGCYIVNQDHEIYFPHLDVYYQPLDGWKPFFTRKCLACRESLKNRCIVVALKHRLTDPELNEQIKLW